jgi:hypothetical protein
MTAGDPIKTLPRILQAGGRPNMGTGPTLRSRMILIYRSPISTRLIIFQDAFADRVTIRATR